MYKCASCSLILLNFHNHPQPQSVIRPTLPLPPSSSFQPTRSLATFHSFASTLPLTCKFREFPFPTATTQSDSGTIHYQTHVNLPHFDIPARMDDSSTLPWRVLWPYHPVIAFGQGKCRLPMTTPFSTHMLLDKDPSVVFSHRSRELSDFIVVEPVRRVVIYSPPLATAVQAARLEGESPPTSRPFGPYPPWLKAATLVQARLC